MVKNLPAVQETSVQSIGQEDPLEKAMSTHSSILAWRYSMDCIIHGVTKSWKRLSNFHFTFRGHKPGSHWQVRLPHYIEILK